MSVAIVVFRSAKERNFRGAKGDNYFCASPKRSYLTKFGGVA